jgi:hypothetical protein
MPKVIFFKEKDGEVFAYFPDLTADSRGNKTSYSHNGQHSACSKEYLIGREMATLNEYFPLLEELKQQGYTNLEVLNENPEKKKTLSDIYLNFIW